MKCTICAFVVSSLGVYDRVEDVRCPANGVDAEDLVCFSKLDLVFLSFGGEFPVEKGVQFTNVLCRRLFNDGCTRIGCALINILQVIDPAMREAVTLELRARTR